MDGDMEEMVRECQAYFEAQRIQEQFKPVRSYDD